MTPSERADTYLKAISDIQVKIAGMTRAMNIEFDAIRDRYRRNLDLQESILKDYEDVLETLVKDRRDVILAGGDRADLTYGAVLLKTEKRVKRIRTMLDRLKAASLTPAIKVAESVDWDVVEKYDDETLAGLGTMRVEVDRFSYEVKVAAKPEEVKACA